MRRVIAPEQVLRIAAKQAGLVSARQCARAGVSSDRLTSLVRAGTWERVVRGVYDTGAKDDWISAWDAARLRSAWLGLLACGPRAIAVGSCALALRGIWGLPLAIEPQVALPAGHGTPGRGGIRVRRFDAGMTTTLIRGRTVATLDYAIAQALPELTRDHAVAVLDHVINRKLIDLSELRRTQQLIQGRRGAARTHEWWALVDGRAESPLETSARLACHDAGMPPDDLQIIITDRSGRFLGRGDMGWRREDGTWVIAELDGIEFHDTPIAVFRDRERQNELQVNGAVTVLRFTSADVRSRVILEKVRQALGRTRSSAA